VPLNGGSAPSWSSQIGQRFEHAFQLPEYSGLDTAMKLSAERDESVPLWCNTFTQAAGL
jgi:hypothetical protein